MRNLMILILLLSLFAAAGCRCCGSDGGICPADAWSPPTCEVAPCPGGIGPTGQ